jgi:hypothetical protein
MQAAWATLRSVVKERSREGLEEQRILARWGGRRHHAGRLIFDVSSRVENEACRLLHQTVNVG